MKLSKGLISELIAGAIESSITTTVFLTLILLGVGADGYVILIPTMSLISLSFTTGVVFLFILGTRRLLDASTHKKRSDKRDVL